MVFVLLAGSMKPPEEYVDFIAVGQGDAILVVSRQTAAMVDVGPDPAANRVLSHLRNQGIRRLEWVLITHQHPDHYRGLETLVQYIEVGHVLHGPLLETSGDWLRLQERLSAFGIPMREVSSGEDLLGTIHLQRFAPVSSKHISENDRSVALRIDGQAGSVLLTGDLEAFGEKRLSSMDPGQVDVLKLGHHGSQTSTTLTLLNEILPSLSVASCGDRNRYGFPHKTILHRLQRAKIPVLSTAQHGLIRIILGDDFEIQTMRSSDYGTIPGHGVLDFISDLGGSTKKAFSAMTGS